MELQDVIRNTVGWNSTETCLEFTKKWSPLVQVVSNTIFNGNRCKIVKPKIENRTPSKTSPCQWQLKPIFRKKRQTTDNLAEHSSEVVTSSSKLGIQQLNSESCKTGTIKINTVIITLSLHLSGYTTSLQYFPKKNIIAIPPPTPPPQKKREGGGLHRGVNSWKWQTAILYLFYSWLW